MSRPDLGEEFMALAKHEPRLLEMLAEARAYKHESRGRASVCANVIWYGVGADEGLKGHLEKLVGWFADTPNPKLRSCNAYDVATFYLYAQLPNCRNCGCACI